MESWSIKLRNDREIILRFLTTGDKELLLEMVNALSNEALLWSSPPYDEAKIDRWMSGVNKGLTLVAVYDQKIVGISAIYLNSGPRWRGIGGMMIYLHQEFHGRGFETAAINCDKLRHLSDNNLMN